MNVRTINIPNILHLISVLQNLPELNNIAKKRPINVIVKTLNNYKESFIVDAILNDIKSVNNILVNIQKYILSIYKKKINYNFYYKCSNCDMKNTFECSDDNNNKQCLLCDNTNNNLDNILISGSFSFHNKCINKSPQKVYSYLNKINVYQCVYCLQYSTHNKIIHSNKNSYKYIIWDNILKHFNLDSYRLSLYNSEYYLIIYTY